MWVLFWKETCSFFDSLIAYVVMSVFLTSLGLFVWVFPETNVLDYGYADSSTFFSLCPYVLIFLIPALTMRAFAEERRNKTLDILLSAPLHEVEIIAGKYMATLFLLILSLSPSLLYFASIYMLGSPIGNLDMSQIWGAYIGLLLLSASFVAIGICISALCTHQILAFIAAAFVCFVCYAGLSALTPLGIGESQRLMDWSLAAHYEALGRGLLDSREIIFFLSIPLLLFLLTAFILRLSR